MALASTARLAGRFVLLALLLTVAGAVVGLVALAAAGGAWADVVSAGRFERAGERSLAALWGLAGLVGGGMLGASVAVSRALRDLEQRLGTWLAARPADAADATRRWSVAELRQRWEQALEHSIGRLPLPGVVARLVRRRLGTALVDEFLAECQRAGKQAVGPGDLRAWLAARGPGWMLAPVAAQVRTWRVATAALLAVLGAAPLAARWLVGR